MKMIINMLMTIITTMKINNYQSGEGMAAIPVIKRCMEEKPDCAILMTSTTASAL